MLFDKIFFEKTAQKTACILIKLAQKNATRNGKKIPQRNEKNRPIMRENRPTGSTAVSHARVWRNNRLYD